MNSQEFNRKVHFWGRLTLLICMIGLTAAPLGIAIIYGVEIAWSRIFSVTVSPFITYTISSIVGLIALVPIIGGGALYVANVTGNVNNVKAPAAISSMDIIGAEPGTEKGDTISLLAVCVTALGSTFIMIMGMVFLAPLFKPVYESAFFSPAFGVILPSLYGALLTPYFLKGIREAILPFFAPTVIILLVGRSFYSSYSSYIMLVMMIVAVGYVYLLHRGNKNGDQK